MPSGRYTLVYVPIYLIPFQINPHPICRQNKQHINEYRSPIDGDNDDDDDNSLVERRALNVNKYETKRKTYFLLLCH